MDLNAWFSGSGQVVMLGWALLAVWPWRGEWLYRLTGLVIPAGLGLAYAIFIVPNFADVDGGGYGSLRSVRALFSDDRILLAGWIHYLAFDLAVGTWIAWKSDRIGLSRLLQLPILFLTFQFGPIGLSIFVVMLGLKRGAAPLFERNARMGDVA